MTASSDRTSPKRGGFFDSGRRAADSFDIPCFLRIKVSGKTYEKEELPWKRNGPNFRAEK